MEILLIIFNQLSYTDQVSLSSVNTYLHNLRGYLRSSRWKNYRQEDQIHFQNYPMLFREICWRPSLTWTDFHHPTDFSAMIVDSTNLVEYHIHPKIKHLIISQSPILRAHHVHTITAMQNGYTFIPYLTLDSVQQINMPGVHIGRLTITQGDSLNKLCLTKVDNILDILNTSPNLRTLKLVIYPRPPEVFLQVKKVYLPAALSCQELLTVFPNVNHMEYTCFSSEERIPKEIRKLTIRYNTALELPQMDSVTIKNNMASEINFHGSQSVKYTSQGEAVHLRNAHRIIIVYSLGSIKLTNVDHHEYRLPKKRI